MSPRIPIEPAGRVFKIYAVTIVLAVLFASLIRSFIVEAYRIPNETMRPTLEPGDTLFAAKWSFGFRLPGASQPLFGGRMPERGELVVFSLPEDPSRDSIKRVLGLPGDRVAIRKGQVEINGKPLAITLSSTDSRSPDSRSPERCGNEEMTSSPVQHGVCLGTPTLEDFGPKKVPDSHVFVLGDLRAQPSGSTTNSKTWGMIPLTSLKAKPLWIWLSIEPHVVGAPSWHPRFRFERMFRKVD